MSRPTIALAGRDAPDSAYAWLRLGVSILIGTIGGVGMWSVVVALPAVQAEFSTTRSDASLPFTVTMLGFGLGGLALGRMADRRGIVPPLMVGAVCIGVGYILAGVAAGLWQFALAEAVIGFGCSVTLGPLISDVSHWFMKRRGFAVGAAAASNMMAGAVWPPITQHFIDASGWRPTHTGIGVFTLVTLLPLAMALRPRPPALQVAAAGARAAEAQGSLGIDGRTLTVLLCIAGVACCVAMSMPQVHIVAYCGDLGYGVARGAEMLAAMMGFAIVSRLASGFIADRIGGVATLLLGSGLQAVALVLYMGFDGLVSLYVISALFGLFQGGIVPSYAIIVREYFPPHEAGTRTGIVLMATLFGMALGGWMSGLIFDLTGSYKVAFFNGLMWSLLNFLIMLWLLVRPGRQRAVA